MSEIYRYHQSKTSSLDNGRSMLHSIDVGRTVSNGRVQLVPGIEGPRRFTSDQIVTMSRLGAFGVKLRVEYDDDERRYVCTQFTTHRVSGHQDKGFVTSETLRYVAVADLIGAELDDLSQEGVIRELPNPDNVEPWGWTPPEGLTQEGPTDRVLKWVAHLYRYRMAVSQKPAKAVEDTLKLPHGTTARWIRLARQKDFLGPSEGPGRSAG